ncbi:MAG: DNA gyrase subunit A [Candidatus Woesearchaeota archaeon]
MRYCVTGDTLIATKQGLRPIKTLSTGEDEPIKETVLSYDGKRNKATRFFNSGKHPVITAETQTGHTITGSHNHPVLTWTFEEKPALRWKRLDKLREGDVIVLSRDGVFPTRAPKLVAHHPPKGRDKDLTLPAAMNKELAFLLGALVAEGSYHQKKILFNNSDDAYYEKVKQAILNNFKGTQLYERDIMGGCKQLEIYHQRAVKFLHNIGYPQSRSDGKHIPQTVLQSPRQMQRAFLQGLFDGSVRANTDKRHGGTAIELCYHSKSKRLIKELKTMLLGFGIATTKPYQDKRNKCYKLQVTGHDSQKRFYEEIGFSSEKKQEKLGKVMEQNEHRMSRTDFIPHLATYLRDKYTSSTLKRNNFDRYNLLRKNREKLRGILDEEDNRLIDTLIERHYLFSPTTKITRHQKPETVYSVKVDSMCHSFVADGFINHNTEAKMERVSDEMLADIEKGTVDMAENFDGTLKEPTVLPTKLPNLLINGSSGIAVGMATNIPPHNLTEVGNAVIELLDNPEAELKDLIQHVKGPDFPTGGIIQGTGGIQQAYMNGRGRVRVKARFHEEEKGKKTRLIITEIPYMVNKSALIEQIADNIREKRIEGITDLRDESDRQGMRVVIELRQDANAEVVKNQLYKHTRCQETFGVNSLALVEGQPKTLGLKELLDIFIRHRKQVITRRTQYDLDKAKAKAHVLEGLVKALDHIDAIIQLIKQAANAQKAQEQLMSRYDLSEEQSKAILEMRLSKLAALEQESIRNDLKQTRERIAELEAILASEEKVKAIIKEETQELIKTYGDERRTTIVEGGDDEDIDMEDLIEEEDMVVTLSTAGYVKRTPLDTYKAQRRGGKGIRGATTKEDDVLRHLFIANTHHYLLVFTDKGRVHWLKVYRIPQASRYSKGTPIINLVQMGKDERVSTVIPLKGFDMEGHYLITATERGLIKKTPLEAYSRPRRGGINAVGLNEGDHVVDVRMTDGDKQLLLATAKGMAVKFHEKDARPMGRTSRGVRGVRLGMDDKVVSMVMVNDEDTIATITEHGYGKRTKVDDYRLINRGGKGVRNIVCSPRNGKVVCVKRVETDDDLLFISSKGTVIRTHAKDISVIGRNTQGVRLMRLGADDKVVAAAKIVEEDNGDVEESGE